MRRELLKGAGVALEQERMNARCYLLINVIIIIIISLGLQESKRTGTEYLKTIERRQYIWKASLAAIDELNTPDARSHTCMLCWCSMQKTPD